MASAGGEDEPEFQIAPMIDVVIVMLVFFMTITSTQVLKVDKSITLPVAPHAAKKDDKRSEAIVNVRWLADKERGVFVIDDKVYERPSEIVEIVKGARETAERAGAGTSAPAFRVIIRADENAHAMFVSQAMNAVAEAGVADISFSAVNKQ